MTALKEKPVIEMTTKMTAFALAAGLVAAGCTRGVRPAETRRPVPIAIETITVHPRDVRDVAEVGGTLRGRSSVVVSSRLLATVARILVAPGGSVRTGQVLVQLEDRDLVAGADQARAATVAAEQAVTRAKSDLAGAEAAAILTKATAARVSALHQRRSATAQELDEATAAFAASDARLSSARAGVDQARASLDAARAGSVGAAATADYATIVSPVDGIVTEKFVEAGQMLSPGAPVLRVEDVSGLELLVRVDESRGAAVVVGASLDAIFDTPTGPVTTTGRVTEVSRASDSDSHTMLLRVAIPPGPGLQPGAFGRARLPGQAARLLLVPADAVIRTGQVTSVFAVADGVARLRLVRLGPSLGSEVAVVAGLSDGDVIVTRPASGLRDGVPVASGAP